MADAPGAAVPENVARPLAMPLDAAGRELATGTATVVASTVRLRPGEHPRGGAPAIELAAARGEVESAQVVYEPAAAGPVDVSLTRLAAASGTQLPARRLTLWRQVAVDIEDASPEGASGRWFDALLPVTGELSVTPGEPIAFWLDVAVPRQAIPGSYRGELRLEPRAGGAVTRVPIELTVAAAVLPATPVLESSVGLDADEIARLEGVEYGSEQMHTMIARYVALLGSARLSPADTFVAPDADRPDAFAGSAEAGRLATLHATPGVGSYRIPFYETFPFSDPLGADRRAAVSYLRSVARHYARSGWLARSYVYILDEPQAEDADRARAFARLVHEADPRLRIVLTTTPAAAFSGAADTWAVNLSHAAFDEQAIARARAEGEGLWLYPSISTHAPFPTLFIDDDRPSARALGWVAWRVGASGLLYWSATHWSQVDDPWRDPATYREGSAVGNGDGSLVYPGRSQGARGPLPSLRLLRLRDGIEDYELLDLASSCRGRAAIDAIAARLAATPTDFATRPEAIDEQRRLLLQAASACS